MKTYLQDTFKWAEFPNCIRTKLKPHQFLSFLLKPLELVFRSLGATPAQIPSDRQAVWMMEKQLALETETIFYNEYH